MVKKIHKFYSSDLVSKVLVTVFFILFSLGQLQRLPVVLGGKLFFHDLIILLFIGWQGITKPEKIRLVLEKIMQLPKLATVLLLWIGLSLAFNFGVQQISLVSPILYLFRLGLYAFFLVMLMDYRQLVEKGLLWAGIAFTFFGFFQYIFIPDTRFLFFLGWDDHYYRLLSTFLDPGFTGLLLVLFFWFIQSKKNILQILYGQSFQVTLAKEKMFHFCLSGSVLLALALTYSRAAYLALLVSCFLFFIVKIVKKNWRTHISLGLLSALFVVIIPFLPRPGGEGVNLARTASISARAENVQEVTQSLQGWEWLLGKGIFVPLREIPNQYELISHAQIPDNWFIFILAGTGIVGLVMALALLREVCQWLYRKNLYLLVMLISILVHGLFSASIVYPFVVLFLGCCWVEMTRSTR
jgi:hypothetical protein